MAKRGCSFWLANPVFESSGPIKSSFNEYPWKWDRFCCQGCPSAVQPWGLICCQLWILGDRGTGAAVAVVVCRYQKGQLERHEHLYNKAIIWGLNISHSQKIPLLFLPMTVPKKVFTNSQIKKCNFLHIFYHFWIGLCWSSSISFSKSQEKYFNKENRHNYMTCTVMYSGY